jgi:hypothetical protein
MTDERQFNEEEIAEILERATSSEASRPTSPAPGGKGLTLAELQEVGSEVGIAPGRIAEVARAVASRGVVVSPRMFFGTPRSVSRTVRIPRPLEDGEWNRLVADLRETFDAQGEIRQAGDLRSWNNGNLQVHVEPDGEEYRVRMRTFKGSTVPALAMSGAFLFMATIFFILTLLGEASSTGYVMAALFGLVGVGNLGFSRATLPSWAEERAAQMEGLAERIPLLLNE